MSEDRFDRELEHALEALDRLLRKHPRDIETDVVQATRALVHLRDRLIALRRRPGNEDVSRTLTDVNAIISEVMGGHYAIDGVQWKSIEEARNALGALAPRASRSGHTPNSAPPPAGMSG
jgi:hypothetical protein